MQDEVYTSTPLEAHKRITTLVFFFAKSPLLDRDSIAQEVWMEADAKKLPITPMLVKNRVIDAWRRAKRRREIETLAVRVGRPSIEQQVLDVEKVYKILDSSELTNTQLSVIYLKYYQDKSNVRIMEELSISASELTSLILDALDKLRANPLLQEVFT